MITLIFFYSKDDSSWVLVRLSQHTLSRLERKQTKLLLSLQFTVGSRVHLAL